MDLSYRTRDSDEYFRFRTPSRQWVNKTREVCDDLNMIQASVLLAGSSPKAFLPTVRRRAAVASLTTRGRNDSMT